MVGGRLTSIGAARATAAATVLLVGALGSATRADAKVKARCARSIPVIAHRAGGAMVTLPRGSHRPIVCASATGDASSESSIAVTNDGALVYSPAETENSMARSLDGGASWSLTTPAEEQATSFWNTVDPYVIADRRTGRIFWVHATGPVRNMGGLPQGAGFYLAGALGFEVYSSSNDASTFTTADYEAAPTGDWEKIFVGPPPPPGTGAAQPVGYPDVVYVCANSPVEDGGVTFSPAGFTSPTVSNPQDICPPLNFNTGVVDSQGVIYQPVDCERSAYIVVSRNEGETETWFPEPGAPTGTAVSGTNLKLAVDDGDNLYATWTANGLVYLAVSRDHALTWSAPMMISSPGALKAELPAIAAGANGNVAVTYYASTDPSAQRSSAYITQTADALDSVPLLYSGTLNDPKAPIFHNYGLTGGSPRADFVGGAYDGLGTAFWAGVIKQLGPSTNGQIPTTGFVGTLLFGRSTPRSLP
jgi:hypothetical protein